MATWSYLAKYKGYRTSPNFPIRLDGDGAISIISWDAMTPHGTSVTMETNVSFNDGRDWDGWMKAVNGGPVPQIQSGTPLKNAVLKYRFTAETTDKSLTPTLSSVSFYLEPVLEFNNKGDVPLKPELWITKMDNGDFTMINTSNGNEQFKFTDLIDGETVYVNSEKEQIETSLAATYRYSNFNDQYLEFPSGINVLRIIGNAKLQFRHQFKLLQG
ncbi:phage tail domain-containing protein [Paenibacillus sp. J2TS4]|uniref:phage tail domain-containing protein n=1 Tax=Paenibacillus sp. J2TS4 TaxID=2807194 RepID=UPI001B2EC7CB|nr:phage tail domain-containing protein [Paenibacillus sp. J2TS4]GIP32603.1 hypothetical protein J2TS4_18130 [Paenibacillus sp. J2TS4]